MPCSEAERAQNAYKKHPSFITATSCPSLSVPAQTGYIDPATAVKAEKKHSLSFALLLKRQQLKYKGRGP